MDDAAIPRRRLDEDRWKSGRLGGDRGTTLGVALYRVVTPPVSAPGIATCNPVALDALEASGGSASVAADTDVLVPVVVLEVPLAGAKLACLLIDGHWVAQRGLGGGGDCPVCITVTGCGSAIAADVVVYPSTDHTCTGTPIYSGSHSGTALCFDAPGEGDYDIKVTPTGPAASVYETTCGTFTVSNCAVTTVVTVDLPPQKYNVSIKVGGKPDPGNTGCGSDFTYCYCGVPGATVRWQDGANDVTATSDADGYVAFTGLDTPAAGAGYTITVSGIACGFNLSATFSGTISSGDLCVGLLKLVTLNARGGYQYMSPCYHPLPTTLYLDIYGTTVSLAYVGYTSGYDIWEGCTGITCAHRATPTTCTFDEPMPAGEQFRYAVGSGTVYVKFRLYVAGRTDPGSHSICGSTVDYTLEVYGVTVSSYCDIFDEQVRLADKTWRFVGPGSLNNPANWVQDTWDCTNVPAIGGVTVASDSGTWTDFCTCDGFSIAGSVGSPDGIPCAADNYTLRYS